MKKYKVPVRAYTEASKIIGEVEVDTLEEYQEKAPIPTPPRYE